jgi:hypothetical protein
MREAVAWLEVDPEGWGSWVGGAGILAFIASCQSFWCWERGGAGLLLGGSVVCFANSGDNISAQIERRCNEPGLKTR